MQELSWRVVGVAQLFSNLVTSLHLQALTGSSVEWDQ